MASMAITGEDQWIDTALPTWPRANQFVTVTITTTALNGTRFLICSKAPDDAAYVPVMEVQAGDFIALGSTYYYRESFIVQDTYRWQVGVPTGGYVAGATITVGVGH